MAANNAIDRFFDLAEAGVDALGKLADTTKARPGKSSRSRDADPSRVDQGMARDRDADAGDRGSSRAMVAKRAASSAPTAKIVEAIDAQTGAPVWTVKNDRGDRAECNSRRLAEIVRGAMDHG